MWSRLVSPWNEEIGKSNRESSHSTEKGGRQALAVTTVWSKPTAFLNLLIPPYAIVTQTGQRDSQEMPGGLNSVMAGILRPP